MPVFGFSRSKTLLVDSGQESVVLAQAFESDFPLSKEKAFPDLSCLTCARLASSVSNLTSPCNERTWNAKGTDTIMTSPEREAPKTSTEISSASIADRNYTFGYFFNVATKGGSRSTRLLPHAKMLLVLISFFLCWVDYALEGSTFSLSKCDFSRLFHTERSWHTYQFTVFLFLVGRVCSLMHEYFLFLPLLKRKAFYCG